MARARSRPGTVTSLGSVLAPIVGARAGFIVEVAPGGEPRVDYQGNRLGPIAARSTVDIPALPKGERLEVLLVFESNDPIRPIVIGLLRGPGGLEARGPRPADQTLGRRLVLEAPDEVEIRCGPASITLRRNGRIVLRGLQIESRATGANKIRGGSVQIN